MMATTHDEPAPAPLRTLVVDDERLARDRLIGLLARVAGVEVVGQAVNGLDAVAAIERTRPDVVFLDVQMPGMDGFAVLRALTAPPPQIVFATAHPEQVARVGGPEVAACLLKPFGRARVAEAVARVRARLARRGHAGR